MEVYVAFSEFAAMVGDVRRARAIIEEISQKGGDAMAKHRMGILRSSLTKSIAADLTTFNEWGTVIKGLINVTDSDAMKVGRTAMTKFVEALKANPAAGSRAAKAIDNFKRFADHSDMWSYLLRKSLTLSDDQAQLAAMAKLVNEGQLLKGFDLQVKRIGARASDKDGDIDVLTNMVAASVKSGKNDVEFILKSPRSLDDELRRLLASKEAIDRHATGLEKAWMVPRSLADSIRTERPEFDDLVVGMRINFGIRLIEFDF